MDAACAVHQPRTICRWLCANDGNMQGHYHGPIQGLALNRARGDNSSYRSHSVVVLHAAKYPIGKPCYQPAPVASGGGRGLERLEELC